MSSVVVLINVDLAQCFVEDLEYKLKNSKEFLEQNFVSDSAYSFHEGRIEVLEDTLKTFKLLFKL